jgi:hypothetical protein
VFESSTLVGSTVPSTRVLRRVAAVDGDEIDVREIGGLVVGVVELDETVGVGADLVVVDLVDDELRMTGGGGGGTSSATHVSETSPFAAVVTLISPATFIGSDARDSVEGAETRDDGSWVTLRTRRACRPRIALLTLLARDVPADRRLASASLRRRGDLAEPSAGWVLAGVDHSRRRLALGERDAGDHADCHEAADEQNRPQVPPSFVLTKREIDAAEPRG